MLRNAAPERRRRFGANDSAECDPRVLDVDAARQGVFFDAANSCV